MQTRSRDRTWTFAQPFWLKGVDRELPAGSYRVEGSLRAIHTDGGSTDSGQ